VLHPLQAISELIYEANLLIPNNLLMHVFFDNITRSAKSSDVSTKGDNLETPLTPDRPNLELSTQVKVLGSEEVAPKEDPSQMSPLIQGTKAC
jgi:hypothetical protein